MKARIQGREVELNLEGKVRGGVMGTRRESIGLKGAMEQSKASGTPVQTGKAPALPVRSMPIIGGDGSNPAPSPLVIAFFVEGLPQTKGSAKGFVGKSKKTGKPRAFITNDNTKNKSWAKYVASQARLHARSVPMDGPVYLELSFFLPRPKHPKHPVFPIVRPDLDKMTRSIQDALKVGGVYTDDSRVCVSLQRKLYTTTSPGVHILVREHLLATCE